jgi:hypothetical protein
MSVHVFWLTNILGQFRLQMPLFQFRLQMPLMCRDKQVWLRIRNWNHELHSFPINFNNAYVCFLAACSLLVLFWITVCEWEPFDDDPKIWFAAYLFLSSRLMPR